MIIRVDILQGENSYCSFFDNSEDANAWVASMAAQHEWAEEDYSSTIQDITNILAMDRLRMERNSRLAECDWTQLADAPLDSGKKSEWAAYRQALRDLPEQEALDLENPNWPVKPA